MHLLENRLSTLRTNMHIEIRPGHEASFAEIASQTVGHFNWRLRFASIVHHIIITDFDRIFCLRAVRNLFVMLMDLGGGKRFLAMRTSFWAETKI